MQKLSDLVNEKYKTDKTIVSKENSLPKTKLEENLLTAILPNNKLKKANNAMPPKMVIRENSFNCCLFAIASFTFL